MNQTSITLQLWHFFLHLRLHYQFFILSGGYLLASLFVEDLNSQYWLQFLNVHVLLFGGATAYNSYWDKDEGPIGGLKSPPEMTRWMWMVSLGMQFIGLGWAYLVGLDYAIVYLVSLILFWLYSTPHARWKGHPWLSMLAIGISTGTNSFLMGYLAASGNTLGFEQGIIALGVACVILSLYPASQVFQYKEDQKRGDRTFAMEYGLKGVRVLYSVLFPSGVLIISWMLYLQSQVIGMLFFFASIPAFVYISYVLWRLEGKEEEYEKVMRIKFLASFSFVVFILSVLLVKSIV
jgi:4-hydroxybenzoate polyprenyltransferase